MTPHALSDRDNPYTAAARLDKAHKLAAKIEAHYPEHLSEDMLDVLPSQSFEWWTALASTAGVKAPSAKTIALVCDILRQRLNASDPFENLGKPVEPHYGGTQ